MPPSNLSQRSALSSSTSQGASNAGGVTDTQGAQSTGEGVSLSAPHLGLYQNTKTGVCGAFPYWTEDLDQERKVAQQLGHDYDTVHHVQKLTSASVQNDADWQLLDPGEGPVDQKLAAMKTEMERVQSIIGEVRGGRFVVNGADTKVCTSTANTLTDYQATRYMCMTSLKLMEILHNRSQCMTSAKTDRQEVEKLVADIYELDQKVWSPWAETFHEIILDKEIEWLRQEQSQGTKFSAAFEVCKTTRESRAATLETATKASHIGWYTMIPKASDTQGNRTTSDPVSVGTEWKKLVANGIMGKWRQGPKKPNSSAKKNAGRRLKARAAAQLAEQELASQNVGSSRNDTVNESELDQPRGEDEEGNSNDDQAHSELEGESSTTAAQSKYAYDPNRIVLRFGTEEFDEATVKRTFAEMYARQEIDPEFGKNPDRGEVKIYEPEYQ